MSQNNNEGSDNAAPNVFSNLLDSIEQWLSASRTHRLATTTKFKLNQIAKITIHCTLSTHIALISTPLQCKVQIPMNTYPNQLQQPKIISAPKMMSKMSLCASSILGSCLISKVLNHPHERRLPQTVAFPPWHDPHPSASTKRPGKRQCPNVLIPLAMIISSCKLPGANVSSYQRCSRKQPQLSLMQIANDIKIPQVYTEGIHLILSHNTSVWGKVKT